MWTVAYEVHVVGHLSTTNASPTFGYNCPYFCQSYSLKDEICETNWVIDYNTSESYVYRRGPFGKEVG
jgi:hypothetical protein